MSGVLGLIGNSSTLNLQGVGFQLGSFVFQGTEIPEQISSLGGTQRVSVHEFPGGSKSLQAYGAFPSTITWKGLLSGTNAMTRSVAIDQLRVTGAEVQLRYAQFAYVGVITEYAPKPKHQWRIPYEITYEPIVDISGGVNALPALLSAEINLANQISGLNNLIQGNLFRLNNSLIVTITSLLSVVQSSLQSANGIVANISTANVAGIVVSAAAVIALCNSLTSSAASSSSSPALDALSYATIISTIVSTPQTTSYQIRCINPNLYLLAAQYLGDQSLWPQIASYNGLIDPMPIGEYVINIP